jgi:hypothetical protein
MLCVVWLGAMAGWAAASVGSNQGSYESARTRRLRLKVLAAQRAFERDQRLYAAGMKSRDTE